MIDVIITGLFFAFTLTCLGVWAHWELKYLKIRREEIAVAYDEFMKRHNAFIEDYIRLGKALEKGDVVEVIRLCKIFEEEKYNAIARDKKVLH